MSGKINIEAVYALPDEQTLFRQSVPEGATVAEAIELCGILEKYPEIDLAANKLGIFGKLAKADTVLRDKDRIANSFVDAFIHRAEKVYTNT